MRYLGLALFAEGRTDHAFLSPLLRRVTEEVCRRRVEEDVEVSEVTSVHSQVRASAKPRLERILEAAREAFPDWQVLFVHTDANGDESRSRDERVSPAVAAIREEFASDGRGVGVVPVRETEAWALADGAALREALGVRLSDEQLGAPAEPRAVEDLSDPKRDYERACLGHRRSRGPAPSVYLPRLGETISLEALSRVPAFGRLRAELVKTLRELHILRR